MENITRIKFEKEKLINLMVEINDKYGERFSLDYYNKNYYYIIVKIQNKIRDIFDEALKNNKIKLTSGTSLKKPDYFALFMCFTFINRLKDCNEWEDVINKLITTRSYVEFIEGNDEIQCCCSQKIGEKHSYINKEEHRFIITGVVCIEKNIIKQTVDKKNKQKVDENNELYVSIKKAKSDARKYRKKQQEIKRNQYINELKQKEEEEIKKDIENYIKKYSNNGLEYLINKMRINGIRVPCFVRF